MRRTSLFAAVIMLTLGASLSGCSDDEDSASTTEAEENAENQNEEIGPDIQTQRIAADGFYILFDPAVPEVIDDEGAFTSAEVTITVFASDVNDLPITTSGHIVEFETEWGDFIGENLNACEIADGFCTVIWRTGTPGTTPPDCRVDITAMAVGEEFFEDDNRNGVLDDGETFADYEEPYLDINGNGQFDENAITFELVNEFIEIENFPGSSDDANEHDGADGKYTGSLCAADNSDNCTSATSMVIHYRGNLLLTSNEAIAENDDSVQFDVNGDGNIDGTLVRVCNSAPYP